MLKIGENFDTSFYMPEAWHEKCAKKIKNFPYEFSIGNSIDTNRGTLFLLKPKNDFECAYTLAISKTILEYYNAREVPDSNFGFAFEEYLPVEDTQILITSIDKTVQPAIVYVSVDFVEEENVENHQLLLIDLYVKYMASSAFTSLSYFAQPINSAKWKFLLHEDTSYMTDYEKVIQDTFAHKHYIQKAANKMISYLNEVGAETHAKLLAERIKSHDDSKFKCEDELHALARIINDKSTLKDATKALSTIKKDAIKLHWKHNSHHPEHYKNPIDMSKLDILEMVCDWYSRSLQYHTDFLEYVKVQQETRFKFPEWMFNEIYFFCTVIAR